MEVPRCWCGQRTQAVVGGESDRRPPEDEEIGHYEAVWRHGGSLYWRCLTGGHTHCNRSGKIKN